MKTEFSSAQLARVIDQALVYQCACPAQVCSALIALRDLYDYQQQCLEQTDIDRAVHEAIAKAALDAHQRMEQCLEDILKLEDWDRATLTMPDSLKKRPVKAL